MSATIIWTDIKAKVELSDEERKIVEMLIARKTLADIGKALGQHRSMIWRKVERIKKRAVTPEVAPSNPRNSG